MDDQFNDGIFKASFSAGKRERPAGWPKSVSEMRGHTAFGTQGLADRDDTGHCTHMLRRVSPARKAPPRG
jgi:hypothetical protein